MSESCKGQHDPTTCHDCALTRMSKAEAHAERLAGKIEKLAVAKLWRRGAVEVITEGFIPDGEFWLIPVPALAAEPEAGKPAPEKGVFDAS